MRYIVGYAPNARSADAIAFASALARTQDAELDIVHVLSSVAPTDLEPSPERTVQELRTAHAREWLSEALEMVPGDVSATAHVVYADSFAEGLLEAAQDSDAGLILVGAAKHGPFKRFTIGSVASALLHASPLPVALVPSDYEKPERISRMTAAIGSRDGAGALLDVAVSSATRRRVPLRLLSLIALDYDEPDSAALALTAARQHAQTVLDQALSRAGTETDVTATVAERSTIERAVGSVPWDDGEILLIGSSRLAEHRKIFMGSTANKILRALPIPLIVVPRELRAD